MDTEEREKGTTPARRAMSASPSCQCMASAARQGTAISSATLDHISGLNLGLCVSVCFSRPFPSRCETFSHPPVPTPICAEPPSQTSEIPNIPLIKPR